MCIPCGKKFSNIQKYMTLTFDLLFILLQNLTFNLANCMTCAMGHLCFKHITYCVRFSLYDISEDLQAIDPLLKALNSKHVYS